MARTTAGSSTHGTLYELDAIAAVVIGGTLLSGGRGTIVGTVFGVLIFTTLTNVFTLNNLSISAQAIAKGLIIVAAVLLQQRVAARSAAAEPRHHAPSAPTSRALAPVVAIPSRIPATRSPSHAVKEHHHVPPVPPSTIHVPPPARRAPAHRTAACSPASLGALALSACTNASSTAPSSTSTAAASAAGGAAASARTTQPRREGQDRVLRPGRRPRLDGVDHQVRRGRGREALGDVELSRRRGHQRRQPADQPGRDVHQRQGRRHRAAAVRRRRDDRRGDRRRWTPASR